MMDLEWKESEQRLKDMQDAFNRLGPDALFFGHYELEARTGIGAAQWREFLTNPQVSDWLNQEHRLLKQVELRKLTRDISQNARSTGTSQTLNALAKSLDSEASKDGPIFIFNYIPLSPEEEQAPNVNKLSDDPFRIKG